MVSGSCGGSIGKILCKICNDGFSFQRIWCNDISGDFTSMLLSDHMEVFMDRNMSSYREKAQ